MTKFPYKKVKEVADNYGCLLVRHWAYGMDIPYSTKADTLMALLKADKRSKSFKTVQDAVYGLEEEWCRAAERRREEELEDFVENGTPFSYYFAKQFIEDKRNEFECTGLGEQADILKSAWVAGAEKLPGNVYHAYYEFGDVAYTIDWKFKRGDLCPNPLAPKSVTIRVEERP